MTVEHDLNNRLREVLSAEHTESLIAALDEAEAICAQLAAHNKTPWSYHARSEQREAIATILSGDQATASRLLCQLISSDGRLSLEKIPIQTLPEALRTLGPRLVKLELWRMPELAELPSWLFAMPALELLRVVECKKLKTWAPLDAPAPTLKEIAITSCALTQLPESIAQLSGLQSLELDENTLTALPASITQLTGLKVLGLTKNKLTTLPDDLAALSALERLTLKGNPIKKFPFALLSLPVKAVDGIPGFLKNPRKGQLEGFLRKLKMVSTLSDEERARIFELFQDDKHEETFSLTRYFEAQQVDYEPLRERAMAAIFASPDHRYEDRPLSKGSVVTVLGKTSLKKTEIKDKLKALDIGYTPSLTDKVTHVVIGPGARGFEGIETSTCAFMSEDQLVTFLTAHEEAFLLEPTPEVEAQVDNVAELLMSDDEATQRLGLTMLKAGGVPPTLMTELFIVARLSPHAKVRAEARKLVKLYGTPQAQAAVADRKAIMSDAYFKRERLTCDNLWGYHRAYGQAIDMVRVARWLYEHHKCGLSFLVTSLDAKDPRKLAAYDLMFKDGVFDLYNNLTGYKPDYLNAYASYASNGLPSHILTYTSMTELQAQCCHLIELPAGISALRKLKVLNLDYNKLTALPDTLDQLTELETILLSYNAFPEVPPVLLRMPWLKQIDLRFNRSGPHSTELAPRKPTDAVRAALPNTEILV